VIIEINNEERVVEHEWIHRNKEARQSGSDRYGIVGLQCDKE
jgi:hypothetical protein